MKSIPVSKIDALIAELKPFEYENRLPYLLIKQLEDLKKESEEMIPLSTVEARIKELENQTSEKCYAGSKEIKRYEDSMAQIEILRGLKKELTKDKGPPTI